MHHEMFCSQGTWTQFRVGDLAGSLERPALASSALARGAAVLSFVSREEHAAASADA